MLTELVGYLGWENMGEAVAIRCFLHEPSITSSLKFLRRTPWARTKVEELYIEQVRSTGRPGQLPPKARAE